MSDATTVTSRRLSPGAKAALGVFARYGTIIGLIAMIAAFSILSPKASTSCPGRHLRISPGAPSP